ncbi:MAG: hypothetical protein ACKVII_26920 [Planctomycetales bacterium]|jgi:hypothetical protein
MVAPTTKTPGIVEPGCIYHVDELLTRLRWSRHAWRTARRNGLKVIRTAGRAYVSGDDVIAYLISQVDSADEAK